MIEICIVDIVASWAYKYMPSRETTQFATGLRMFVTYVNGNADNMLHKIKAGLLSSKRRIVIIDAEKTKVATLKAERLLGIGVEVTKDVSIGVHRIGRVLKRKPGFIV